MINRHIIQVTLREHNINKVYARGNEASYNDEYLNSFYITRLHIKRHNIEYTINGKNRITSMLDECFENNEYSQLAEISSYFKRTIHYIEELKTKTLTENSIKAANYKNNDNIKRTDITLISLIDLIKKAEIKEDI